MGISWLGPAVMVLTAVAALGCVLTGRNRRPVAVVASTGMVVAMTDMALGHLLLTPVAWAGTLVTLGVVVVALPRSGDDHTAWHHGLALVAAAAIVMLSPHGPSPGSAAGHSAHPGPVGATDSWMVGLAVALAYAVAALLALRRPPTSPAAGSAEVGRGRHLLQVIATTGCLVLMAVVPSVA